MTPEELRQRHEARLAALSDEEREAIEARVKRADEEEQEQRLQRRAKAKPAPKAPEPEPVAEPPVVTTPNTPDQERILACLGTEQRHIDSLAGQTGLPVARVLSALTILEMRGQVRRLPYGHYLRCGSAPKARPAAKPAVLQLGLFGGA